MVSTTTKGSNMTKKDRLELKERIRALDYWNRLTCEKLLELRCTTQKELLEKLRSK